jgi:hypothetical protein
MKTMFRAALKSGQNSENISAEMNKTPTVTLSATA